MSLYDDASIILTPNAYKAGKLYSLKPTDGTADFDVVRATTATRVNEDGLLESVGVNVPRLDYSGGGCPSILVEPQSTNLITYPVSFTNKYWTKSGASVQGDASTAGIEVVVNGDFATDTDWTKGTGWTIGGGVANATSATGILAQVIGAIANNAIVLITMNITGSPMNFQMRYGGLTVSYFSTGNISFYATSNGNALLEIIPNGAMTGTIDNVSVKEVQGFSAPSVDNPTSAFKLVATANNGNINRYIPATTGNNYANSIWIKRILGSGTVYLGSPGGAYTTITLTSEWERFDVSVLLNDVNSFYGVRLATAGDEVMIFGAQNEQLSYPTSLILPAVEGSTSTRNADVISITGLTGTSTITETYDDDTTATFTNPTSHTLSQKRIKLLIRE